MDQQQISIDSEVSNLSALANDLFVKMKSDGYEAATQPVMENASACFRGIRMKFEHLQQRLSETARENARLKQELENATDQVKAGAP